jgi:hypothetical protein
MNMENKTATLVAMAARAIRDNPGKQDQLLEQFATEGTPELKEALDVLGACLGRPVLGEGHTEVEKMAVAAIRSATVSAKKRAN